MKMVRVLVTPREGGSVDASCADRMVRALRDGEARDLTHGPAPAGGGWEFEFCDEYGLLRRLIRGCDRNGFRVSVEQWLTPEEGSERHLSLVPDEARAPSSMVMGVGVATKLASGAVGAKIVGGIGLFHVGAAHVG